MDRRDEDRDKHYWSILTKNGEIVNDIAFNTEGYTSAEVYPLPNENSCLIIRNSDEFTVVKLDHLGDKLAEIKFKEKDIE